MIEVGFPVLLEFRHSPPNAVDSGASFRVDVVVDTESGSDLSGAPYHIVDGDGTLISAGILPALRSITPDSDQYDPRHGVVDQRPFASIALVAPKALGDHKWTLRLPASEVAGLKHEAARLCLSLLKRDGTI